MTSRRHVDDLRAATKLAVEATLGVSELVEELHREIGAGPSVLGRPLDWPARLLTALAYGHVRRVTRVVGTGVDYALAQLAPLLGDGLPSAEREALQAALNGVLGDYLEETHNPLALELSLHCGGQRLVLDAESLRVALPAAGARVAVLVHGSCMAHRGWKRRGHDHGAALARDLGYTPVYVQYNSGLHVSVNGRRLAAVLEALVAAWPTQLDELNLVGFSMGGLVARSACHEGERSAWRTKLRRLVCLGSPHHGALLERGGNLLGSLLGVSRYSAPFARLARLRSAGITDLRHGSVREEDWHGVDRFALGGDLRRPLPLPDQVACFAMAATRSTAGTSRLAGDGLVSVDSALGRHPRGELALAFPPEHQHVVHGMGHLDLLDRAEVYEVLRRWLTP